MVRLRLGERRDAARAELDGIDKSIADATAKLLNPTMPPAERQTYSALTSTDLKVLVAEAKTLADRFGRR